jgi:hypothetical protein
MILTKEHLHEIFSYKDGHLYWKIKPSSKTLIGTKAGCSNKLGYVEIRYKKTLYLAHRLIFMMFYGFFPKQIDHIDGNKGNNLIENLREANNIQNSLNKPIPKSNKSGIKNVSWQKSAQKWQVNLCVNKEYKYFGLFDDLELAQLVAIEARDKYHGKFANHL